MAGHQVTACTITDVHWSLQKSCTSDAFVEYLRAGRSKQGNNMGRNRWFCLIAAFCLSALPTPVLGRDKPKPVYDRVGTLVSSRYKPDFRASYEANGQEYDYWCDSDSNSVDCHEGLPGDLYSIKLPEGSYYEQNGKSYNAIDLISKFPYLTGKADRDFPPDPLHDATLVGHQITFRLEIDASSQLLVCVPYDIPDRHGEKKKEGEACYSALPYSPPPSRFVR